MPAREIGSDIRVAGSREASARELSSFVQASLKEALQSKPRVSFAISGGTTPALLFADLAQAHFDWTGVHFFWVDERCVLPTDQQSNFKLANETLFLPAAIPKTSLHRILGELTPEEGAISYIREIENFFELKTGELPVFDLLHRGIGPDAHTASLFPGEPLIQNETGIAASVWVEKMKSHRVTLLPGVLKRASKTVIQAAGEDKAEPVFNVLRGPEDVLQYPCQIATRGASNAIWFVDKAAAQRL